MADITMCVAKDCPFKDSCYRKTAKPSTYQSQSDFESYLDRKLLNCDMYYDTPNLKDDAEHINIYNMVQKRRNNDSGIRHSLINVIKQSKKARNKK